MLPLPELLPPLHKVATLLTGSAYVEFSSGSSHGTLVGPPNRGMITIRTRCAIAFVVANTMLFTFAIVCFSMHVMDRTSPAWKGGSGLPKMHQMFLPQRTHRTRNRLLTKEDVQCTYNNTMTLFVLSDGVNRERRNSLRRLYRDRRSVRNFCMKYLFVIYGELQKSEKALSDYLTISSYIQGYVEPVKVHFAYKSKPKDLTLKSALGLLQEPTSSESSSEETTEDESEETVEETIEEDDTQKKVRTSDADNSLDVLSKGRDVGKRHLRRRTQVTKSPRNRPPTIEQLLQDISTPRDVTATKSVDPSIPPVAATNNSSSSSSTAAAGATTAKPCVSTRRPSTNHRHRSRRNDIITTDPIKVATSTEEATVAPSVGVFEGFANGLKSLFGSKQPETPTAMAAAAVDDDDVELELSAVYDKEEKSRVTLFATRCDGRNCVPIDPPEPCNCSERAAERLAPETQSRMNSLISVSKIQDNRRLEEASSNSRWKVFVQDQQPVELHSLVAHLNHEAKVLAKLEPCCSSLDGCTGCNHMFRQKLHASMKLVPTISTKDTFALEDDVRKVIWNDPNDVILEFHVEPRGHKVTRYWKVFNM